MSQRIHSFLLDLDMKLVSELTQIDRFDASWASEERNQSHSLKELKSVATVQSIGASTRIEGSRLSNDEVTLLIKNLAISKLEERDQQEVAGYYSAMEFIYANYETIDLTESNVKYLHNLLMKFCESEEWHRGDYKKVSNAVEASMSDGSKQIVFRTTEPGWATRDAMRQLLEWYQTDDETLPLVKVALFTYEFLSVHPFQDGNGRLSRLLTTLLLLKNGYRWIQYTSFEQEIENRKSDYYRVLMATQRHRPGENVTPWLEFFLSCLSRIQQQLRTKLKSTTIDVSLSQREQRIVAIIRYHPGISSGEISTRLSMMLPTVKKSLNELVEKGVVIRQGRGRGTVYITPNDV